jgi:hypothetical protein
MSYTRCQDRSCPKQQTCIRYDARPMEEPSQGYFGRSPRSRDECSYYYPVTHPGMVGERPTPLTNDNNPKDDM